MKDLVNAGSGRGTTRLRANRKRRNWRGVVTFWLCASAFTGLLIFLFANPSLRIRTVRVVGAQTVDPNSVIAMARVPIGANLFLTVLSHRISKRVEADPEIASASAMPSLPHTVVLRIEERRPYVVLNAANGRWLLDKGGVPYRQVTDAEPGLPVLAYAGSLPPGEPVLGHPMSENWLKQAYRLIALVKDNKNLSIQKITVDQSANLCLNRQDNLQIKLGQADSLPLKIALAQTVVSADNGAIARRAAYIDLSSPEQPVWLPRSEDRNGKNEDGTVSGVTSR